MKSQRSKYYLAASVALAALVVYLSCLQNDFVLWDDDLYVYENPFIRSFGVDFFRWAFFDFHAGNWHPLTWISHAVDYAVWGLNPFGHHLTNIILHALNSMTVVLLTIRLIEIWKERGGRTHAFPDPAGVLIAAGTTGLLFGLHPVHVESVAWVSERKDLLCALFFLMSIMAYMSYTSSRSYKTYSISLVFFVLALLSKPMAITLPAVLLILDWYPMERIRSLKGLRTVLVEKLPFMAPFLVSAVLTVLAQRAGGTIRSLEFATLSERGVVGIKALLTYLWKMVLPMNLVPFYPYPEDAALLSIEYLSATVLVCGITITCVVLAKRQKLWLSVWGYYVTTLLPVLGIVQVGRQAMADRYTYLPSLGLYIVLGLTAAWAWEKSVRPDKKGLRRHLAVAASVVMVISLSYMTYKQTGIWRNSIVFWSYVIEKEPRRVPDAYNNRGSAFLKNGLPDRAIEDFDKAISLDPSYYEAYNNRGTVLLRSGLIDKAIADYDKAISIRPGHAALYVNRGKAYFLMGRYGSAEEDFNKSIFLNRNYAVAYLNRGTLFFVTGNKPLAVSDFKKACDLGSEEGCARLARVRG